MGSLAKNSVRVFVCMCEWVRERGGTVIYISLLLSCRCQKGCEHCICSVNLVFTFWAGGGFSTEFRMVRPTIELKSVLHPPVTAFPCDVPNRVLWYRKCHLFCFIYLQKVLPCIGNSVTQGTSVHWKHSTQCFVSELTSLSTCPVADFEPLTSYYTETCVIEHGGWRGEWQGWSEL